MKLRQPAAPAVKPSLLDRAVGYIAPQQALKRHRAKLALKALTGFGYNGGKRSRRALGGDIVMGGGPEADLNFDLDQLRAQSRDLYRNAPIPRGAIDEKVSIVVGPGHIVAPQIDRDFLKLSHDEAEEWEGRASQIWRLHARSENIHAGRALNFADLEALALRSTLMSGDCFIINRMKARRGVAYETCFQIIEGDLVANPSGQRDTAQESAGVRRDRDGEATAYHIFDQHPGEIGRAASRTGKWYPALTAAGDRRIRHLMFTKRPGQVRGEPFLAPVIESMRQLGRYSDAELMAAVVNACFAVTTKSEDGEGVNLVQAEAGSGSGADEKKPIVITEPGMITDLGPDESIESFTPGRPSAQFDPFFRAIISQVAVALETTEEVLMRSFKASYSASRGSIEVAYRFAASYDSWLCSKFNQPCYEALISEAIARGDLAAPGFFSDPLRRAAWLSAIWIGPARMSLDPMKEAKADEVDLALGVTDKIHVAAKRGRVFEQVAAARDRVERIEEKYALEGSPNAGGESDDPSTDDESDDADGRETENGDEDDETTRGARRGKGHPMQINVNLPKIDVNVPEIKIPDIILPEIRVPDIIARVDMSSAPAPRVSFSPQIEVKAPVVHVAAPQVTVEQPKPGPREERTLVTKHDAKGRIIEFVKTIKGEGE